MPIYMVLVQSIKETEVIELYYLKKTLKIGMIHILYLGINLKENLNIDHYRYMIHSVV